MLTVNYFGCDFHFVPFLGRFFRNFLVWELWIDLYKKHVVFYGWIFCLIWWILVVFYAFFVYLQH